ncbi:IS3 family transposase [Pediococcus acidilactici]|uniref:IS3 family transposase n=1 Tax=Lactobacillaceae TaxID=33958 RepID=UPI001E3203D3|nr:MULTISPECIES: IS3 family transposase [Lactobacillaceae]MCP8873457.1 IS3 family transposase [Latilactobacillus curvatus]MCP8875250.1 IS3 family transposase [Latilactobacillus curvatus]
MGDILNAIGIKKATYHDERKRLKNYQDKYADVKKEIIKITEDGKFRGRLTYGYRRVQKELLKLNIHLSDTVIRRLMDELNVQVSMYNRHKNGKYSSYKGNVGRISDNILKQTFNETLPYKVLHTDVTQVRLKDNSWAYISAITDEASKEVLAFKINDSPNSSLIISTLNELIIKLPESVQPIIHSDQGWHYQLNYYTEKLKNNNFIQSMSRKGNCHDNAPIESFFHLYKTECLNGFPPCKDISELTQLSKEYVEWFNHRRISLKTKNMSPAEYREHTLVA